MGWFKSVDKSLDIVDQFVLDKDKANELKAQIYLAELQTKTVPVVDALHKMGRQIMAFAQLGFYCWALKNGHEINFELVAGVSGVAGLYTVAKGKGK